MRLTFSHRHLCAGRFDCTDSSKSASCSGAEQKKAAEDERSPATLNEGEISGCRTHLSNNPDHLNFIWNRYETPFDSTELQYQQYNIDPRQGLTWLWRADSYKHAHIWLFYLMISFRSIQLFELFYIFQFLYYFFIIFAALFCFLNWKCTHMHWKLFYLLIIGWHSKWSYVSFKLTYTNISLIRCKSDRTWFDCKYFSA